MKLRIAALIFGIAFLGAGIAWYLPFFFDSRGLLLGLFQVDAMHNKIHLASGLVALAAASLSSRISQLYFKIFGLVYGLLGIVGLVMPEQLVSMQFNTADHVLHLVIGFIALMLGFRLKVPAGE
ncbi:MAG TPA: DUF4383 domain-containing protein [Gammaproteobacteria bacterium]|nr:DUF4383 domain-containing protein [Gammaproteobacteria bacterium]